MSNIRKNFNRGLFSQDEMEQTIHDIVVKCVSAFDDAMTGENGLSRVYMSSPIGHANGMELYIEDYFHEKVKELREWVIRAEAEENAKS